MDLDNLDWETAKLVLDELIHENEGGELYLGFAAINLADAFGIDHTKAENLEAFILIGDLVLYYMEAVHGIGETDPRMIPNEAIGLKCLGFELVPFPENEFSDDEDEGDQLPPPNNANGPNDDPSQGGNDGNQQNGGNYQGHGNVENYSPGGFANFQEDSEPESDSVASVIIENLKKEETSIEFESENVGLKLTARIKRDRIEHHMNWGKKWAIAS